MNKTILENIKIERINKGLSQEAFAKKMNVSRSLVSKWEEGRILPSIEQINACSKVLGISISNLLSDNELKYIIEDNYEHDIKKKTLILSLTLLVEVITIIIFFIFEYVY